MSKFKIGDKVRVRKDLEAGQIYGGIFLFQGMYEEFQGYEGEINTLYSNSTAQINGSTYFWSLKMLELVEADETDNRAD